MEKRFAYEILAKITTYLRDDQQALLQLSRTCKRLHTISTPFLFCSPKFDTFRKFESFANALTLLNGTHVRYLDLHMVPHRWDSSKIDEILFMISEKTSHLELLNLDHCSQLTNKALIKILKPLHHLRILSIDQCRLITDESIKAIVSTCPNLQKLYLGSTRITDQALNLIATNLVHLSHLYIPDCQLITELGIKIVTEKCQSLKYINIEECYNIVSDSVLDERMNQFIWPALNDRATFEESRSNVDQGSILEQLEDEWTDVEDEEEEEE
ncbi:uncharacterized protein BX663DRAFT_455533 [Cokeromyces recurvatus]|uniref:uncharacterized protein n=1 Tax=Cokeromyces recurvatus TaxID=90255 RepID=UPI00221E8A2F|nr:uncharacterized protein BX663DRAFT_455533 [Cokeromyces recurvatus]KAI7902048.1 hypothetical protein BX663DRAFT_455533 [Cokeromyces recurvatus]